MADRKDSQPPAAEPHGQQPRKPDLRKKGKMPAAPAGNIRLADQNRKLLGKHYANKYRIGR